ncbi:unnamed protein product [Thlaspi arvense]|uniref:F-box domain-containing protein n=1 Tax=Thlaspi arvense TaxID=13288 RepID=A0AAU9RCV7_THLAR|nr:unnamed protein product [Thlaspi arvense]
MRGSSLLFKQRRYNVVELILESLPVKSLLRFKSVSKNWKSTIESQRYQERQWICRRQSRGPDVLRMCLDYSSDDDDDDYGGLDTDAQRVVVGPSKVYTVRFPTSGSRVCFGSCDGLVCLYTLSMCTPSVSVVVNPATRCHRSFPLSTYQQLTRKEYTYPSPELGFGKDKVRGTYKPVWLYNSSELGLDNVTTCEVFDFSTNAWRYVVPASPYPIHPYSRPVYLDGSLYWLTGCKETKVLSLDLHTETFQVICRTPYSHVHYNHIIMCILDNRLCLSYREHYTQEIWSLDSSGTWKEMCSIDLTKTRHWFGEWTPVPVAILEKSKLLLRGSTYVQPLVIHDLHSKSYDLLFKPTKHVGAVYYFQSLFSV